MEDEEKEKESLKNSKISLEKEDEVPSEEEGPSDVPAEQVNEPKVEGEQKNQPEVPTEQVVKSKMAEEKGNEPNTPSEQENKQNEIEENGREKEPSEQETRPLKSIIQENKQKEAGEHEDKPKKSTVEKKIKFQLGDDVSVDSVSSEVIRNEFKDMYGEGDQYEEMGEMENEGEDEGEEEETSEEEDLSEFKFDLEKKYMKGVQFSEEYLVKENKKIEDVPLQLYAIETYINSVRTFYGYGNHWLRIKIFDIPCFEIKPCKKVNTQASLYPNRSINLSKGSLYADGDVNYNKPGLEEKEPLSERRSELENKRLDFDLSKMSAKEKRMTIDRFMREEVTRAGTELFSETSFKSQSKEKDVGLDIPVMELLEEEQTKGIPLDMGESKVWILREPLENGKTVMFPMRPAQMVHQLQRQPLNFFVMSTTGLVSSGQLELSGLTEAVIRASKGPPYPICSIQRFKTMTTGDFTAKVVGTVRVVAIGPRNVSKIKCEDNVNEERCVSRINKPKVTVYNMDSQNDKAPILTGPQNFTLCDIVENIRARRQKEKYMPRPKPEPKRYYVEDLVFNRATNTVVRAPKKTYQSLRAEIDRYLVLNKSPKKKPEVTVTKKVRAEDSVSERSTIDEEEGCEEEQEIEVGEEEDEDVYGIIQKAQTVPPLSDIEVEESSPTKQSKTKKGFKPSAILKRFGSTNPKRKKKKGPKGIV